MRDFSRNSIVRDVSSSECASCKGVLREFSLCGVLGLSCLAAAMIAGCSYAKRAAPASAEYMELKQEGRGFARATKAIGGGGGYAMTLPPVIAAGRYLAVQHKLTVVEPADEVGKSVEAVVRFCGGVQCEVLSSSVVSQTGDAVPSGSISLRVAPGDLQKLLDFVGKQGKVAQHTTQTEDKTTIVVDTEARIKNSTEFRDNLRKMMARPGVSVKDLVDIQEKLAEVQSQLDSESAQRKVLANETEKVAVEVEFRSERTTSRSALRPIGDALREWAEVLAESLAALITVVVAAIPWLIVIVPAG
jgi:hypothetical protein